MGGWWSFFFVFSFAALIRRAQMPPKNESMFAFGHDSTANRVEQKGRVGRQKRTRVSVEASLQPDVIFDHGSRISASVDSCDVLG